MTDGAPSTRDYTMSTGERLRRHLRMNGTRSLVGGVTVSGVVAGFLNAAGRTYTLYVWVGLAAASAVLILAVLGPAGPRLGHLLLIPTGRRPTPSR